MITHAIYLTKDKVIKGKYGIAIKDVTVYDKSKPLMSLKCMEKLDSELPKGTYKIDVVFTKTANNQLARYDKKYGFPNFAMAIKVIGHDKVFKVGNTHEECGKDILLGIKDNGLGRLMESITANVKLIDFILKYGSAQFNLIVK